MKLVAVNGSFIPNERPLFSALRPTIDAVRGDRGGFWFVRKRPGLRLRFTGSDSRAIRDPLLRTFESLIDDGVAVSAVQSVYEPEVFLLGGRRCIDVVHRYFDEDTAGWMAWLDASATSSVRVPMEVVSLAVVVDLVRRCIPASEEIWDVWSNIAASYGPPPTSLEVPPISLAQLEALCGPGMTAAVTLYRQANDRLAQGLRALDDVGDLKIGRRALVRTIAAFHWNRFRVDVGTIARLADAMRRAYQPRYLDGSTEATQ